MVSVEGKKGALAVSFCAINNFMIQQAKKSNDGTLCGYILISECGCSQIYNILPGYANEYCLKGLYSCKLFFDWLTGS